MGWNRAALGIVQLSIAGAAFAQTSKPDLHGIKNLICSTQSVNTKTGVPGQDTSKNTFDLKAFYQYGVIVDVDQDNSSSGSSIVGHTFSVCSKGLMFQRIPTRCRIGSLPDGGYYVERTLEKRDAEGNKYAEQTIQGYLSADGKTVEVIWNNKDKSNSGLDGMKNVETGTCTFK